MLNSIRETRSVKGGLHSIILEIPEETYETFYENISEDNAMDILKQYLNYRQDDGVPQDVKIQHNRNAHTINIYANLHYLGNEKSSPKFYGDDVIDGR
ncbi:MAG TPA: hypothetical protein GXX35_01640 [Thermoanaerobacterales bacterium]|nr:hypothetical protein [Thermoanaerobacterales bacterium]